MTDPDPVPEAPTDASAGADASGYSGPGAWGPWALALLGALFVIATAATLHSILVTFGG